MKKNNSPVFKMLTLFFLLTMGHSLWGQGWYHSYTSDSDWALGTITVINYLESSTEKVVPTVDGGYINMGFDYEYRETPKNIHLIKTDAFGNQEWRQKIWNNYNFDTLDIVSADLVQANTGNYLLPYHKVLRYDENYDYELHLKILNGYGEEIEDVLFKAFPNIDYQVDPSIIYHYTEVKITQTTDGNFVLAMWIPNECGNCDNGYWYISKIDGNGNQLWEQNIEVLDSEQATNWSSFMVRDILPLADGGFILLGHNDDELRPLRLDENGNVVWETFENANVVWENDSFWGLGWSVGVSLDAAVKSDGNIIIVSYEFGIDSHFNVVREINGTDGSIENMFTAFDDFGQPINRKWSGFCLGEDDQILASVFIEDIEQGEEGKEWIWLEVYELDMDGIVDVQEYRIFNTAPIDLGFEFEAFDHCHADMLFLEDGSLVIGGRASISVDNIAYGIPFLLKLDENGNIYTSQICGTIYHDANMNCEQDDDEIEFDNQVVSLPLTDLYTVTDSLGNFCFDVNAGIYTPPSAFNDHFFWEFTCTTPVFDIELANNDTFNIDLGYNSDYECPLMTVNLGTPLLRRCFGNRYTIQYCNEGTEAAEDAYIDLTFDEYIQVDSSEIDYQDLGDNVYRFDVGTVQAGNCDDFKVFITVDCEAPLGLTICNEAHIYPDEYCGDINDLWDMSDIEVEATCEGDSVAFLLRNVGEPMVESRMYILYEDDLLEKVGDFTLDTDEEMIVKQEVLNGATYRIIAEEHEFSPEAEAEQATVEMCGDAPFSTGFVTTSFLGDQSPFIDIDCREIIGSYDPNDKLVSPSGVGEENYILADTELEYTVRFQNTGNDTAFTVYILDTLSTFLDLHTFESGVSSHDYEVEILENNIIRWQFDNIYLPDSNINEPASHGFVKFVISPKEDIEQGSVITNQAGIYFDFNAPIITPEVLLTVCDECTWQQKTRYLHSKIFLEGAYNETTNEMNTGLNDLIPTFQPYRGMPYVYWGVEEVTTIPDNMVDWVLVEIREGIPQISGEKGTEVIDIRAGILLSDGRIVDVDGESPLAFEKTILDKDYYFCIRHRNHLDVLSAYPTMATDEMYYDFTQSQNQAFGAEQLKESGDGIYTLYAGDYNGDGVIQLTDYDVWVADPAELNAYENADGNLDGVIQLTDFDEWRKNKAKIGNIEIGF